MSSRRRTILWTFVVFGLFGVARFFYAWLDDLARNETGTWAARLIEELTGAWAMALVFLALVVLVRRYPLERGRIPSRTLGYAAFILAAAVLHTTMMWGSRALFFPLFGLGAYDYGIMRFRYPMEAAQQVPNILIFIGLIHGWFRYQASRARELRAAQLESELAQARLVALQGQLEPHFLFNTLNAISSVMYADPATADRMLSRLSELLRRSIQGSQAAEVPLAEELAWLDDYLALMRLRFGERLSVNVESAESLGERRVPRLILQPLVENALLHGAGRRAGPARVRIAAGSTPHGMELVVEDDGPGMPAAGGSGGGVGLENVRSRLLHHYGERARLRLESAPGKGTRAVIEIPDEPSGGNGIG